MKISSGFVGERFIAIPFDIVNQMENNLLTNRLYIFAIGHFPSAQYHYVKRPTGCNEYILIYCTNGSGCVQIHDVQHHIHADEYIVIPPNVDHSYWTDANNPWSIYWVHFRGECAADIAESINAVSSIPKSQDSRIDERISLFDEIYAALNGAQTEQRYVYANLLFLHFMATFKYLNVYRGVKSMIDKPGPTNHSDAIIRKCIHFMNENLESNLSLSQLAEICNFSKSYLYRKFIKEIGIAPMDYFSRLKINRACMLLTHTNLSISQISYKLSFSESQYFARTFKKIMGVSASEYRKHNTSSVYNRN